MGDAQTNSIDRVRSGFPRHREISQRTIRVAQPQPTGLESLGDRIGYGRTVPCCMRVGTLTCGGENITVEMFLEKSAYFVVTGDLQETTGVGSR